MSHIEKVRAEVARSKLIFGLATLSGRITNKQQSNSKVLELFIVTMETPTRMLRILWKHTWRIHRKKNLKSNASRCWSKPWKRMRTRMRNKHRAAAQGEHKKHMTPRTKVLTNHVGDKQTNKQKCGRCCDCKSNKLNADQHERITEAGNYWDPEITMRNTQRWNTLV